MTRIKVCARVIPDTLSRGIHRVANALIKYAPDWVQIVNDPAEADIRIGHVIGYEGMEDWVRQGDYAIIQYCLRTGGGSAEQWHQIWKGAKLTWSYYDLKQYLSHELPPSYCESCAPKIMHRPLGVDSDVFVPGSRDRIYAIGTSGYVAETEGVRESITACRRLRRRMLHLGPRLALGPGVDYIHEVSDAVVAEFWGYCERVAGLRRIEGFELPVLEGLMCGARPVVFDAPHYTQWFGSHVDYIPEGSPEQVADSLTELMSRPPTPVSSIEREHLARQFYWGTLAKEFWEALR